MGNQKSVFETLSAVNVNSKVEKKNNLTYLSWAWAWAEVKKHYPNATYHVVKDENGKPYVYDEQLGFMCSTKVTINNETLEMWLPVMDGANKSMKKTPYKYTTRYGDKSVDAASMFDINKTIMRCLVKNLAMFGLGHYIYAGDDLPESQEPIVEQKPQPKKLIPLNVGDDNWDTVLNYAIKNKKLGIKDIGEQLQKKYSISAAVKKELSSKLK